MKCSNIELLLYDYVNNFLTDEDKVQVKHHLKTCLKCSEKVSFLKKYSDSLSTIQTPEISANFNQKVFEKIKNKPKFEFNLNLDTFSVKKFVLAACFIILIAFFIPVGFYVFFNNQDKSNVALIKKEDKKNSNEKKESSIIDKKEAKPSYTTKKSEVIKEESNLKSFDSETIIKESKNETSEKNSLKEAENEKTNEQKGLEKINDEVISRSDSSIMELKILTEKKKEEKIKAKSAKKSKDMSGTSFLKADKASEEDVLSTSKTIDITKIIDLSKYGAVILEKNKNYLIIEIDSEKYDIFIEDLRSKMSIEVENLKKENQIISKIIIKIIF